MKLHPVVRALLSLGLIGALFVAGCSDSNDTKADVVQDLGTDTGSQVEELPVVADVSGSTDTTVRSVTTPLNRTECSRPAESVIINEFLVDPGTVSDADGEWVELYNPGTADVDILGWFLRDSGTNNHEIGVSLVIPAGGYVVLCRNTVLATNGGVTCDYGYSNFYLSNDGDSIILLDVAHTVIDSVTWGSGNAPTGRTIALRNPYLENETIDLPGSPSTPSSWDGMNFGASTTLYGDNTNFGTPGAQNEDVWMKYNHVDCFDNNLCTHDVCDEGTCANEWIRDCCFGNSDCNDDIVCTQDLCDIENHACSHNAISGCCTENVECEDLNPCNADYCIRNECRHSAYNILPGCCYAPIDVNPVTGETWASSEERQTYGDSQCDDKNVCTPDYCNLDTNLCYQGPPVDGCCALNEDCDDGNTCTYDFCTDHVCTYTPVSYNCCNVDTDCNDDDVCTDDRCILNSCRNFVDVEECCTDHLWCEQYADDGDSCTDERCILDPGTGRFTCQHTYDQNCQIDLPYVETFTDGDSLTDYGWSIIDYGTRATSHWIIDSTNGDLGPDEHLTFTWAPTTLLVKSVAITPTLNAVLSADDTFNTTASTTVQWRMSYRHSLPTQIVTLRVVASDNNDYVGGSVLASYPVNEDIPYGIFSATLPSELKYSPTLRIGFMLDTGSSSTVNLESWEIDDVKVAAGQPNQFLKAIVLRCPVGGTSCDFNNGTVVDEISAPSEIPPLVVGTSSWYRIIMCYQDPDGRATAWNYYGFPASYLDVDPMDHPDFVTSSDGSNGVDSVGQANGCEVLPMAVSAICDVSAGSQVGYYYCGIDIMPNGDDDLAGAYESSIVSKDEFDVAKPRHSPFESQVKFDYTVLLEDGYIVWAPNGRSDPSAVAIFEAIKASGRRAQIIPDLSYVSDLAPYDGIFAVLGVYGRYHSLTHAEAARLKVYMGAGGKVYLEGGEFFWTASGVQQTTTIHDYFKVEATMDGVSKQDGPLSGRNFLWGYDYDYSQEPRFNAWNDYLLHVSEGGGREILHNVGSDNFASTISYDSGTYRTIASSILFGGLVEQSGGKTPNDLMGKYLDFLENGYPACTLVEQCEDFEVCTTNACDAGACVNAAIADCVPCLNDDVRPDGSPSCTINQACNVALGYCVDIEDYFRFDSVDADCWTVFGSAPVKAQCQINVPTPAIVEDVQIKAKVSHYYRGDVDLKLTSPNGTTRHLKQDSLLDSDHNIYETYDIGVAPVESVDGFNGTLLNGLWSMVAEDMDPMSYNGTLEGWHLFAKVGQITCTDSTQCPLDPCATAECLDSECVYTAADCDDGKDCTVDSCDSGTGGCVHEVIPMCGGPCSDHSECARDEMCLNVDPDLGLPDHAIHNVCDSLVDVDPISGEVACWCHAIEGTIIAYPYEGGPGELPDPIPDNNLTGLVTTLPTDVDGMVKSIRVKVRTTHTAAGDLTAELCHLGSCITLRQMEGGNEDGFHDVYDWDAVAFGDLQDSFHKMAVAGDWVLTVKDNISNDTGTLDYLAVYVTTADCYQSSDCDDGNPCTVDSCQNPQTGGTCTHTTKQCEPTEDMCTLNVCNPSSGACEMVAQPNGSPCEDGLFCSTDDHCEAGACVAGPELDCTFLDDNCTEGYCSEDLEQCAVRASADGTACDDGEFCNQGDFCESGVCLAGPTLVCSCETDGDCIDDGNPCNGDEWTCNTDDMCELSDGPTECPALGIQCQKNVCDPFDGECKQRAELNFLPCEDGSYCTVADYCESGLCRYGHARDCSAVEDECNDGVCNEDDNLCEAQAVADGTACELDGVGCTADTCQTGTCEFEQMVDCSEVQDDCNDGVCQNVGWGGFVCVKGPLPDGTVCTDEPDPCTEDQCDTGLCVHTQMENCNGPCGGQHAFDAGDDMCGFEDSCQGGIDGYPNGVCMATCDDPNCVKSESGIIDLPIDERIGCTTHALDVTTNYDFAQSVEVKVRLEHGYIGDLTLDVVDPSGYTHRMMNHVGASAEDFANTFDLSFPVPYPGWEDAGVPMCSLAGEPAPGTWYLRVCDTGEGNGGFLHEWKIYVRGSDAADLNDGHRCADAIDLGSQDINPSQEVIGTTECSINSITDSGCGGVLGPDRIYKFSLETAKRVTITLDQPDRDLVLFVKDVAGSTCAAGSKKCANYYPAGDSAEVVDDQFDPGDYYVGVDTAGDRYDYGPFRFNVRVKSLLPDGAGCMDPILGDQDMDCQSLHCQNGYCCDHGDCCPGSAWVVPADGTNPLLIKSDEQWISADTACSATYKEDPSCYPTNYSDPEAPINLCQGERHDANCVDHICTKTKVDDDTACDDEVVADECALYQSVNCEDYGPFPPAAQFKPLCATYCTVNTDCDANAHCDVESSAILPDVPTGIDMACIEDWVNGSECNENSDCVSNHCQNGFCCDSGDCCPSADTAGALTCPALYTTAPECDDAGTCEGHKKAPVCSDNICGSETIRDDCACGGNLSDNCGLFIPVFCAEAEHCPVEPMGSEWIAGDPECLTSCLTGGVENDTKCDDIAHCDADPENPGEAICQANIPNGYPCDEDSDCENRLYLPGGEGHCQNGFCCDYGDCCALASDCPTPSPAAGYWAPPSCNDWATCQGQRMDGTCTDSICGSAMVDDDTACIYDENHPSNQCGYYLSVFCNGEEEQTAPPCPATCLDEFGAEDDTACDPSAHCDPEPPRMSNSICLADLPNDEPCDEASDCTSAYCQIHFCCDVGQICAGARPASARLNLGSSGTDEQGETYRVQSAFGQPSPIGRTDPYWSTFTDLGFLPGVTVPVWCYDGVSNVTETGVDCGGPTCKACGAGQKCIKHTDCSSGTCTEGYCE